MVEKYELEKDSLLKFKFVKEVALKRKNTYRDFKKEKNTTEWLRKQQWATNGEYLACFSPDGRLRCFSLETGKIEYKTETGFAKDASIVNCSN